MTTEERDYIMNNIDELIEYAQTHRIDTSGSWSRAVRCGLQLAKKIVLGEQLEDIIATREGRIMLIG